MIFHSAEQAAIMVNRKLEIQTKEGMSEVGLALGKAVESVV